WGRCSSSPRRGTGGRRTATATVSTTRRTSTTRRWRRPATCARRAPTSPRARAGRRRASPTTTPTTTSARCTTRRRPTRPALPDAAPRAQTGSVGDEVLDVGPAGSGWPSRRVLVAVALVLGVVLLAVYADHRNRVHEGRALEACRLELHHAAVSSDL